MKVELVGGIFAGPIELDASTTAELPDVLNVGANVRVKGRLVGRREEDYKLQRPIAATPVYKHG